MGSLPRALAWPPSGACRSFYDGVAVKTRSSATQSRILQCTLKGIQMQDRLRHFVLWGKQAPRELGIFQEN